MRFGSVCSGIEAASVAWHPLGWKAAWLAEIEPWPAAALAYHYPEVPNLGDMTALPALIRSGQIPAPDVLCGGTPCQAFSVAGLRRSLDDARGNLSLTFCEIANELDARRAQLGQPATVVVWENVPGVLSTRDNAFGCFLAGLAGESDPLVPPGGKWSNAGAVLGPKRAVAWRVLDAQFFGVAQRRRRVFVVASARNGFDPAAVLFEFDGVRRDTAPSRQAGQDSAAGTLRSTDGGGFPATDEACSGYVQPVAPELAKCLTRGTGLRYDTDTDTDTILPVSYAIQAGALGALNTTAVAIRTANTSANGHGISPELAHTLDQAQGQCVAFSSKDYGADATRELSPTLRAMGHAESHANGGGQMAVAIQDVRAMNKAQNGRGWNDEGAAYTVDTHATQGVATAMQVRRLTPTECERLQGFPQVVAKLIFDVCIDHQSSRAHVAIQCHKSLSSASRAGANESMLRASTAVHSSSTSQAGREPLAVLRVRMHPEDELLEVRSLGRLIWSANGAPASSECPPPTLNANTVQELARLLRDLASSTPLGKVASLPSINLSMPAPNGEGCAPPSTEETEGCAMSAESGLSAERFTTLSLGLFAPTCDSTTATLFCCAARAIAGSIPETTLSGSFSFEIEVSTPYTAIPWRGRPASQCPDGPRYKALGNSWAVPNVRWIGARIQAHVRELERAAVTPDIDLFTDFSTLVEEDDLFI